MKSWLALLQREFLEHRGAFLYAPAAIVVALIVAVVLGFFTGQFRAGGAVVEPARLPLYDAIYLGAVKVWASYLMITLFFYFADAFSADRKNNAILFWKSMPQSDLKVLGSKLLAGATIFPLMIVGWMLVTSALGFVAALLVSIRVPEIASPDLFAALGSWVQITFAAVVYIALNVFWYAPLFAWVGLLSTAFRGWSIPLSAAIPAVLIMLESVVTYSGGEFRSSLLDFLSWRLSGFYEDGRAVEQLLSPGGIDGTQMISDMVAGIDLLGLVGGLVFVAVALILASEYRRRRIEA